MEFKLNKKYKQSEGLSLMVNENGCTVFVKNPAENPYKRIPYNTYKFKDAEEALKAIHLYQIYGDENELAILSKDINLWRVPISLYPCEDSKNPHKATVKGFKPMTWDDEFFWYGEQKIAIESINKDLSKIPFEIHSLIDSIKRVKTYQSSGDLKFNLEMCPRLLEFVELAEQELGGEILNQETHIRYSDGFGRWYDYYGYPQNFLDNFNFKQATIHDIPVGWFKNVEEEV